MLYSFKKTIKKNTWRYHYFTPMYQISSWYDLQFLGYRVWEIEICNYWSFFGLPPQKKTWKIRILEIQKFLEISSFYINVPKTTITWGTVPEIRSVTDNILSFWVIFCAFTPLTAWKKHNLEKMRKASGDVINLHICIKNHTIWCMLREI